MSSSKGPRLYRSDEAPGTPQHGDIQFNLSNNRLECYTGSAWGQIDFSNLNAQATTATTLVTTGNATLNTTSVGTITATDFIFRAGYPSLNTASPAFYIPAAAGQLTGAIPSLALRVPFAYNTTGRAFMVMFGGSWFTTTVSLALA